MTNLQRDWPTALSTRGLQRLLLGLLMALSLMQTLGLLHRVAHMQQSAGALSQKTQLVVRDDASLVVAVWGDHSSSAECQLFDQACPDLLQGPVWALPASLSKPSWTAALLLERFALFERFYAARGPPAALL